MAQERNQKLCLLSEIDGNVCLHREGKVLETGLSKKLRLDASKNRGLELACLENPVWENETPKCLHQTQLKIDQIPWEQGASEPSTRPSSGDCVGPGFLHYEKTTQECPVGPST